MLVTVAPNASLTKFLHPIPLTQGSIGLKILVLVEGCFHHGEKMVLNAWPFNSLMLLWWWNRYYEMQEEKGMEGTQKIPQEFS